MKTLSFISNSLVSALGWTLLHAVWQGFAVALLAAAALFLLRRSSSLARYWFSISALGLQLVASVSTFWLYYQPVSTVANPLLKTTFLPTIAQSGVQKMMVLPWHKQLLWFLQAHLDQIVLFWVIGASVLVLRLLVNWVLVQQLKSEGIQLTEPRLQVVFKRLMSSLQISKTVQLFESARVSSPLVIGFFKPVVLLPIGLATGLSNAQIEAVLAHELAHIKRHDYLINLLQSLVEIIYFFHPALWWLSARVRQERENCCDDCAVSVCGSKLALAQALTFVEEYRQTPALAMALTGGKMPLLRRVQRILGVSERAKVEKNNVSVVVLMMLLLAGVSVYAIRNDEKNRTNKPKKTAHIINNAADGTRIELGELVNGILESETSVDSMKVDGNFKLDEIGYAEPNNQPFDSKSDTLNDRKMSYHNAKIDSLSRLMQEVNKNSEALQLDMEQHRFKVEEQERKQETLNWKKQRLQDGRDRILEKRNRVMNDDGNKKIKKSEAEIEKELADYEQQIKAQEQQITDLNKQMAELRTQIQSTEQPLRQLERQLEKINQQNEKLSEQMNRHSEAMSQLVEIPTEMEINKMVKDAMKGVPSEAEMKRITDEALRSVGLPRPPRAPRVAPRPAATPKPAVPPKPKK